MAYDGQKALTTDSWVSVRTKPFRRGIGWRLLISILLVSSVVTLILTAAQLYFEYRRDVSEIERRLLEVQSSYADSLAGSLWQFDTGLIQLQMGGIQRLPDIQALELREANGSGRQPLVIRTGQPMQSPPILREFPLIYKDHGTAHVIGTLRVEATFENVYARLLSSALVILFNQGIKTFIVSLFILLIVHRLVTRHLTGLAQAADSYDLSQPGTSLSLDRPPPAEPDELDRLVQAIQSMRTSLERAFKELQIANRDMEAEISQRRRTEEKLQELVGQLTASNSELQRFAYVASHDLQEPLRGIVLYAQKLERGYRGRLDSDADEFLTYIVGNAKQMYELINDLLTFSRLGRGTTFTTVSLDVACNAAITNLHPAILQSGAKVTVSPMPEVKGNAVQIAELFENLIDNAIKFARPGVAPEITVSSVQENGQRVIQVADNGIGIEPSSQDVFDIFRRHHSLQAYPGTGVGLAICKRIVSLHHGRIWFKSRPGEGTTFCFTLDQQSAGPG